MIYPESQVMELMGGAKDASYGCSHPWGRLIGGYR